MRRQISVMSEHDEQTMEEPKPFGTYGDSGALVAITDKVVGIYTGRHSTGSYIVTPIQPICEQLRKTGWEIRGRQN